jgi:hypothetical protein
MLLEVSMRRPVVWNLIVLLGSARAMRRPMVWNIIVMLGSARSIESCGNLDIMIGQLTL